MRTILVSLAVLAACSDSSGFQPGDAHYAVYGSSGSTVTVQWTPIEGATSVMLERGTSEADLQPIATLDVADRGYLDTGLAPLTMYTYRFSITTAAGVDVEPVQEARTTDDAILITGDATPLGAPVIQTVGAAGAAIAMVASDATVIVPPGAALDGTVLTIQPIASPYPDDDSPGVTITSSVPLSQPVQVAFAYDEIDAIEPGNLTIITHADDGSWISQPRVIDTGARTVSLAMEVGPAAPALWAAPVRFHDAVKLRFTNIVPRSATVKVRETVNLRAFGFFSDDPCDVPDGEFLCSAITAGMLGLGLVDARDAMRPARQSVKELANTAPNSERDWTANGIINGSGAAGTVAKTGQFGAVYTAPPAKPVDHPVKVRFTSVVTQPERRAAQAVPAMITIEDPGSVRITATLNLTGIGSPCPVATTNVSDRFTFVITGTDDNYRVEAITNQITTVSTPVFPPGFTGFLDPEPEAYTMTGGTIIYDATIDMYSVRLQGTSNGGGCTYTLDGGGTFMIPGVALSDTHGGMGFGIDGDIHIQSNVPHWQFTAELTDDGGL